MITNNIKERIKYYFMQNPTQKLRVRQIERVVKVPLPSAIRYAKELEKEEILKSDRIADVTFYSAYRISQKYLLEKKLNNIKNLYDSGLIEKLKDGYGNGAIVLFGSYSKGEDNENSDIDIYIEYPSEKVINLKEFEEKQQRKIQLFIHKNIRETKNIELANNIINGIVLNGFVEVFK
jgi:predicted nucleotidyltransferase